MCISMRGIVDGVVSDTVPITGQQGINSAVHPINKLIIERLRSTLLSSVIAGSNALPAKRILQEI